MSLTKELADYSVSSAERVAADTTEQFDHEKERLRASGLGEQGLKVGARVADFTLRNAGGEDVQLADLAGQGPRGAELLPRRLVPLLQYRAACLAAGVTGD